MRILLIGRTGQLGGDLLRNGAGNDIAAPERSELDITRADQMRSAIAAHRPELVINCAAFHNVPMCEEQPEQAFRVNCVAVRDLAAACRDAGSRLISFSSDYVFGGDKRTPYAEDDLPHPLQLYGISRLAGEHAALSTAPDHAVIIRTCGLYGSSGAPPQGGNLGRRRGGGSQSGQDHRDGDGADRRADLDGRPEQGGARPGGESGTCSRHLSPGERRPVQLVRADGGDRADPWPGG